MSSDFSLSTNVTVNSRIDIELSIILENLSSKNYFIGRQEMLLDGLISGNPFEIVGPSTINCIMLSVNYKPDFFLLQSGESKETNLKISGPCDFTKAQSGTYTLKFPTTIFPCNSPDPDSFDYALDLIGEASFVLPEVSEL